MFFLVERVSNMRSRVMSARVRALLDGGVETKVISESERAGAMEIYLRMARSGRLQFDDEAVGARPLGRLNRAVGRVTWVMSSMWECGLSWKALGPQPG